MYSRQRLWNIRTVTYSRKHRCTPQYVLLLPLCLLLFRSFRLLTLSLAGEGPLTELFERARDKVRLLLLPPSPSFSLIQEHSLSISPFSHLSNELNSFQTPHPSQKYMNRLLKLVKLLFVFPPSFSHLPSPYSLSETD